MDITDPRAIKFSNEVVRPLAERIRQLHEDCNRAKLRWQDEIGDIIPNDAADVLIDGHLELGHSVLDGSEINAIAGDLNAYITWFESVAARETRLAKASVRTLRG